MKEEITNHIVISDSRCTHRFANGRRCRQLATGTAGTLCFDHARSAIQAKDDFAALPSLIRKPEDFQSAEELNASLGALHNLLAEGRISPRRAAVIAYVDSLILRTLPAIEHEAEVNPRTLTYDAPRPDYSAFHNAPQFVAPDISTANDTTGAKS